MDADILQSAASFRGAFTEGLRRLLVQLTPRSQLGAFILAVANARHDPEVNAAIAVELHAAFERVRREFEPELRTCGLRGRSSDDLIVLRHICERGLDGLGATEHRTEGPWQLQFNPLRSYRPSGVAAEPIETVKPINSFESLKFSFDIPRVQVERFWGGQGLQIGGREASLFWNKYPFARMHSVLVLEQNRHHLQYLDESAHTWAWRAVERLGERMPIGFGFNSLGAFASVGQLHWQPIFEPELLPVMNLRWLHRDRRVGEQYPVAVDVFTTIRDSWDWIYGMHRANRPYNLLYTPGSVLCFARRFQGSYKQARWTSGFAWFECSGTLIVSGHQDFLTLSCHAIEHQFAQMRW